MQNQCTAEIDILVEYNMREYVDFLRDKHEGIEELVELDLLQPFRSSYQTYLDYQRLELPTTYKSRGIFISKSPTVEKAIDLKRNHEDEPDELVLQRILYEHFGLEKPRKQLHTAVN